MKSFAPLVLITLLGTVAGAQQTPLARLEERAFQAAAAAADPSLVRIATVGGVDLVGDLLTGTGPTTGVVVSEDGYIVTSSFNFAARPASILVTLPDERQFAARVVAEDKSRLLTLLKIDAENLRPLQPVPLTELRVGYWAIALGRTFEIGFPNISVGTISALNRMWGRAVQTDAKTSPVNYGGALVDISGRGIGVIVPLSPQQQGETAGIEWYDSGIGFAVPLDDVYRVLPRLQAGETLHHGLMGVSFEGDGPLAGEAKVVAVRPESPADKAGIVENDVIVAVDGVPTPRVPMLRQQLGRRYAGDEVSLVVRRGDQQLDVTVTLVAELKPYQFPYLGILPGRELGEGAAEGVPVRAVIDGSPAQSAALQANDRIVALGEHPTASAADLARRLWRHQPGDTLELVVLRDGNRQAVSVTLADLPDEPPRDVPPVAIPAPAAGSALPRTGRFNEELPGGSRFWVLVPDDYHPAASYGLLLWLHPAGDTMEADLIRAWEAECARRGIILVGLRAAELSGFSPQEEEAAKGVVDWIRERYRIDPRRIALFGHAEGGAFAIRLATKYRDLIRGAIASAAPLREPPPPNDPDYPLTWLMIREATSPLAEPIDESVTLLRNLKYPAARFELPSRQELFAPESAAKMVQWVDGLDRL